MKRFVATYGENVAEGLEWPKNDEEQKSNATILKERLVRNWQQLEAAKVLEGLTIHSRQDYIGTLCVSGPPEKIDALKTFLEQNNLGVVVPNNVILRGAGSGE